MSDFTLTAFSNQLADAVAAAAPAVVQVQGRRRPASGLVVAADVVLTMARAIGRDGSAHVRTADGRTIEADVAGWDPTTGLAALRVANLGIDPIAVATEPARVGHLALALARSWSNDITASAGIVAVIGGPLPTWRGRAIEQIIRTTAPMHDGFAGGALVDAGGRAIGLATASAIRGLGVVLPAAIAWKTAATLVERGTARRGYLGLAGQPVSLAGIQQTAADGRDLALLVVNVAPNSPAGAAGVLTGDLVTAIDDAAVASPEDLLEHLWQRRAGQHVALRLLRGDAPLTVTVTLGEPPARA